MHRFHCQQHHSLFPSKRPLSGRPRLCAAAAWAWTILIAAGPLYAGSIGGLVFEDDNRNGLADAGEAPLSVVRVALLGMDGGVLLLAETDDTGMFLFADLPDGNYVVSAIPGPATHPGESPPMSGTEGSGLDALITRMSDAGLDSMVTARGEPAGSPPAARWRASLPDIGADPPPIPDFPFGRPRYSSLSRLVVTLHRAAQTGASFRHMGLGDSIGFGFNVCGSLFGENGYFEPTTARLGGATAGNVITDKQAIPGHETADLLIPGLGPDYPLLFNDVFHAIDLNTDLVSISIGGNDFLGAQGGGDSALASALVTARRNIQEILSALVSGLPTPQIAFNTVYDNLEGEDPLHNTWAPIWTQAIREAAWGQLERVSITEIYPEYAHDEDGVILGQPGLICNDIFGLDGIHPTNNGYDVHEEKLWQSFGGVTLSGSDQLEFNLGFVPVAAQIAGTAYLDVTGDTTNPESALQLDGVGAVVPSAGAEFRLTGFLASIPDNIDLTHAIVKIRYRTTAALLDDYYHFEASVDGTFSAPGSTPTTWNTMIPMVGSAGNDGAEWLVMPDQPDFRVVAAPLYVGAPTSNEGTLIWEDLQTLSVRVVTTAVGDPDDYGIEWDGAWVEVFTAPGGAAAMSDEELLFAGAGTAVRRAALDRLMYRDRPGAHRAVHDALTHGEPLAPMFIEALSEVGDLGDVPVLRGALESSSPLTRAHAVRSLARIAGPDAGKDLHGAAGDAHPAVRRSVARNLPMLASDDAGELLARLLLDEDPTVRLAAVRALDRMGHVESTGAQSLLDDPAPAVRTEAARVLLRHGDPAGVAVLIEALADPMHARRAGKALILDGTLHEELVGALGDVELRVRAEAARTVGHLGEASEPVIPLLRSLLDDIEPAVRVAAADALSRLGDVASIPQIADRLDQSGFPVNLVTALVRLDDPAMVDVLRRIAARTDAPITARRLATRGLATSKHTAAVVALQALLSADDLRIRRLAQAGLERFDALSPLTETTAGSGRR